MNERPPPESPEAWLQRARSDLALGRAALASPDVLKEDVCFHAQQCGEKALKALLVNRQIPFRRTHALEILIDLLKDRDLHIPDEIDQSVSLTQYAVETRYPGEWEPVTYDEASSALATAERVLRWVEVQIND
jgi:HEPN domain-containing protein